jgi:L-serine deaminase
MTDIPKARAILEELKTCAWTPLSPLWMSDKLDEALALMTRTVRPGRRTGHQKMTAKLGRAARKMHETTNLSNAEIGRRLNIDGGRVSEAINGQW